MTVDDCFLDDDDWDTVDDCFVFYLDGQVYL